MGFEIRQTLVGLMVDKERGIDYEIDTKEFKFISHKPKRVATNQSKWKKIYMDHVQVYHKSPLDNLFSHLDINTQLNSLFDGFNAAILSLNSRINHTYNLNFIIIDKIARLLAQLSDPTPITVSFWLAGLTDSSHCIDLITKQPISMQQISDPNLLDQLFVESDTNLFNILTNINEPPTLPYILILKFNGNGSPSNGTEFQSTLLLADLPSTNPFQVSNPAAPHHTNSSLANFLPKLQDLVDTLAYLPLDKVVNPDEPFFTLVLPFLTGSSRNTWIVQVDLEDPITPDLIHLADKLRRVKTLYSRNKPVTSSIRVTQLESGLARLQAQHNTLITESNRAQTNWSEAERTVKDLRVQNHDLRLQLQKSKLEMQQVHNKFSREVQARQSTDLAVMQIPILKSSHAMRELEVHESIRQLNMKLALTAFERDRAYFDMVVMDNELSHLRLELNNETDEVRLARMQRDQLVDLTKWRHAQYIHLQSQYHDLVVRFNHLAEKYDVAAPLAKSGQELQAQYVQFHHTLAELEQTFMTQKSKWGNDHAVLEQRAVQAESDVKAMLEEAERLLQAYEDLEKKNNLAVTVFRSETQKLTQQLADIEVVLQHTSMRCIELESENEQLRASNQLRGVEVANSLTDIRRQKLKVESDLSDANIAIQNLNTDKLALQQALDRAKAESERLRDEQQFRNTVHLRRRGGGKDSECDTVVDQQEQDITNMQTQFRARECELVDALEDERAQAKKLAFDLSNLQAEVDRTHRRVSRLNELNESMADVNVKLREELATVQTNADIAQGELQVAKSTAAAVTSDLEQLKAQFQKREAELVSTLQNSESMMVGLTNQLKDSSELVNETSAKLARKEDELAHALSRLDHDRVDAKAMQSRLETQLHNLRMDKVDGRILDTKDSERMAIVERDLEQTLLQLEETKATLDTEMSKIRKERKGHERATTDASRKLAQLMDRIRELEDELEKLPVSIQSEMSVQQDQLRLENIQLKEQATQLVELRLKMESAEKKRRDAETRVKHLETEVAGLAMISPEKPLISQAELGKLHRENKRMHTTIQDLQEQVKCLQDDLNTQEAGIGTISQVALNRLKEDYAKAKEQVASMRVEHEAKADQLVQAHVQLKQAQAYEAQVARLREERELLANELTAALTKIELLGCERDGLVEQFNRNHDRISDRADDPPPPGTAGKHGQSVNLPGASTQVTTNPAHAPSSSSSALPVAEVAIVSPETSTVEKNGSVEPVKAKPPVSRNARKNVRNVRHTRSKHVPGGVSKDDEVGAGTDQDPGLIGDSNPADKMNDEENIPGAHSRAVPIPSSRITKSPSASTGNHPIPMSRTRGEPDVASSPPPVRRQPPRARKAAGALPAAPAVNPQQRQTQGVQVHDGNKTLVPIVPAKSPVRPTRESSMVDKNQEEQEQVQLLDNVILRATSSDGIQSRESDSSGSGVVLARKKRRLLKATEQLTISVVPPGTPDVQGRLQSSLKMFSSSFTVPDLRLQAAAANSRR